ncbi:MAG: hypothetical protein ACUVWO_04785 [Thermodesulfobacteriota bacterium]
MDQEMKDYLDRKLTLLATRDDIEKVRQESNANFRKWKEENKNQATEWKNGIKADLEQFIKDHRTEIGPIREEMKEWAKKIEEGTQSALHQLRQTMDSSLQTLKEAADVQVIHSKEGVGEFQNQMKKIEEKMVTLEEKMGEGFTGVKEELGSMIKFSYSDLEKKLAALEARVKTLEKMVLP